MKNRAFPKSVVKYWLILLLIIIVQIIFVWNIVENDRKSNVTEIENNVGEQIQYLYGVVRDKLQNKEYDAADTFLQRWGTHNNRIAEITLTTENGFVLSHYKSGSDSTHFFSSSNTIPYSYHRAATLSLVVDLESAFRSSSELTMTLGCIIFMFSLFLTITTWLYIRQKKLSIDFQNSEKKYRALANESPDLRYRTDNEGRLVFVTQSVHKMTGYTVEEAIGMRITDFYVNPEERELFLVNLQKEGCVNDFVVYLKRKDGSTWWASLNTQFYKDQDSNIIGIDGVARDVTEHIFSDKELRKREAKLNSIFRVAPAGIGVVVDRVIMEANERLCEMVDRTKEELLGENARILYPSDEVYEFVGQEKYRQISEQGTGTVETYLQRKDGTLVNVLLSSTPLEFDDLSAGVTFTATDISKIKDAENKLRYSEQKFRSMMESMSDPVYIRSNDYLVEYMNPAMIKRTGRDASGEFCYKALHDLDEQCPWCKDKDKVHGKSFESDIVSPKDNHAYHVSHSPIVNENGSVSSMTIFRDVTDFKRLESQLLQSQKMESIGNLAGGVAHDFNNILTAIYGHSEMAMDHLEEGSPAWQDVNEIQMSGERAATLTRQLLAFSRKQVIMPKTINLNNLINDMQKMLSRLISEDIQVEISLDEQVGNIYADHGQVEQVILNLVVNARDAVKKQPEEANKIIKISTSEVFLDEDYVTTHLDSSAGRHLQFQVKDSGCGMSEEVLNHVFEPFYTTKGEGEGTGMGLATVYGIVKQNHGSVNVYSKPGQGATFKIYWPIIEKEVFEEANPELQTATDGTEVILLAEDDKPIQEIASRQLQKAGYTVIAAADGKEALVKAAEYQGPIDLLFTDAVMPIMGGKELSEKIKEIYPDILVLFASGYMDNGIHQEILTLGKDRFINKPYNVKDVMIKIRRLLDEKES